MKYLKFLLIGTLFGIVLFKSEVVSWYRIFEMFRFESFHMFGVIGSAVILGIGAVQYIKRTNMKDPKGNPIQVPPKPKGFTNYLVGGTLFGLGWALVGACPGPMYALIGSGAWSVLIVVAAAILGTFLYGLLKNHLPH